MSIMCILNTIIWFVIVLSMLTSCTSWSTFSMKSKSSRLSFLIALVFTIVAIEFASSSILPSSPYLSISDYILLGCVCFILLMFLYTTLIKTDQPDIIVDLIIFNDFCLPFLFCIYMWLFFSYHN